MKLTLIAIMALLLVLPLLAVAMKRWSVKHKAVSVNAATDKTLPDGMATCIAEAAFGTRYLLAAKGTASGSAILCTASLIPLGPVVDEPGIGDAATVALFGAVRGTWPLVASKAIAENTNVYATAGGKVTDAVVTGAYWVGKSAPRSVASGDGDRIVVIPRFPTVNP